MKKVLDIKHLAQDFTYVPYFKVGYRCVSLVFDFEDETLNKYRDAEIRFIDFDYYKFTSEHIEGRLREFTNDMKNGYNSLIEIDDDKLCEGFKHYYIYFDDYGVYECVAKRFEYMERDKI